MKMCRGCKQEKGVAEFPRDRRAKDGLSRLCRPCVSVRNAKYAKHHQENPPEIPATKTCPTCKLTKSSDEFHRNSRRPDGLLYYCKVCWADRQRAEKYGVSPEQLAAMMLAQDRSCAICKREIDLVVDHRHSDGAVRGLLCGNCNKGIGNLQDDVEILRSAILYLTSSLPSQ